jgi:hypothetical protein
MLMIRLGKKGRKSFFVFWADDHLYPTLFIQIYNNPNEKLRIENWESFYANAEFLADVYFNPF